jgi:hypothetical protein
VLAGRAAELARAGNLRTACHLIEFAAAAAPANRAIHQARADIYTRCVDAETSLIGKAIYAAARRESERGAAD